MTKEEKREIPLSLRDEEKAGGEGRNHMTAETQILLSQLHQKSLEAIPRLEENPGDLWGAVHDLLDIILPEGKGESEGEGHPGHPGSGRSNCDILDNLRKLKKFGKPVDLYKEILVRLQQLIATHNEKYSADVLRRDDEIFLNSSCCSHYLSCHVDVVYENQNYIVIDKPWDYRVDVRDSSDKSFETEPVVREWFFNRFKSDKPLRLCHQLDYSTSGVLMLAHDKSSCSKVGKRFRKRQVDKYYVAALLGDLNLQSHASASPQPAAAALAAVAPATSPAPAAPAGVEEVANSPIDSHHHPPLTAVLRGIIDSDDLELDSLKWFKVDIMLSEEQSHMIFDAENGKSCSTFITVLTKRRTDSWLNRTGLWNMANGIEDLIIPPRIVTFVLFKPITGRRHQLRMTAKALDCPILGDLRYGEVRGGGGGGGGDGGGGDDVNAVADQTGRAADAEREAPVEGLARFKIDPVARTVHENSYRMYLHALGLGLGVPDNDSILISDFNCFRASEECFSHLETD